mmetsp:Transcript_26339/g.33184  ORF Transcript_26339/g.33184 Transcript_26339/m.33184 type:complete len:134 (+) Transcript_26339:2-403(+)
MRKIFFFCLFARVLACPYFGQGIVFADQHDGDEKIVSLNSSVLTIMPYANNESWIVTTKLDKVACNATIDFNVDGKPSPPPVNLTATVYILKQQQLSDKIAIGFTDPTATISSSTDYPVNFWIQVRSDDNIIM